MIPTQPGLRVLLRHQRHVSGAQRLLLTLALTLLSMGARADVPPAAHALFSRMQAAGLSFGPGVDETKVVVQDTLVHGLFLVRLRDSGESLGFINAQATLVGGGKRGFAVFDQPGKPARRLSGAEVLGLRTEILAAIDYPQLVPIRYGTGGARRILEISAVDCPSCQQFEQALASLVATPGQLDTTFYLVPSALVPTEDGGSAAWQTAAQVWCAESPGQAWQDWWQTHQVPVTADCRFDARSAQREAGMLRNILRGVGINADYTPTFVLEDGTLAMAEGPRTAAYIRQTFGASQGPTAPPAPLRRWLAPDPAP